MTNYLEIFEKRSPKLNNEYYNKLPDIVNNYMKEINKITGKDYKPFNYYGSPNATKIIVAMGSVCDTVRETVDYLVKEKHQEIFLMFSKWRMHHHQN